jgi:quercetin dioxygenase-like cupin family protein
MGYFDTSNGDSEVRTPQEFLNFLLGNTGTRYARMGSGDRDHQLEPLLITVPPNSQTEKLNHLGEAFFMVLQGKLWVCLEGKEYRLEEGHTAHSKPGLAYSWRNEGPQEVRLIWVGTPRLF